MKQYRINLVLPPDLYASLKEIADDRQVSINELMRTFIKLGILACSDDEDTTLLIQEGDRIREIMIL